MSGYKDTLTVIRERAQRATPGPWGWYGNTGVQSVYLATKYWGRHYVMGFERWGMRGAMPHFFKGRQTDLSENGIGRFDGGVPSSPKTDPIYEVAPHARDKNDPAVYREDIIGIRNADADFIANSRADVDWLISEVDRLQGIVDGGIEISGISSGPLRQVGWFCEHEYGTPAAETHMEWDHRKAKLIRSKNTNRSLSLLHSWQQKELCPASVPVFVTVPQDMEVAA